MAVIEFTWTLIPTIILAIVGLHSLDLLYSTTGYWHEILGLVVKVWAHQWYWSYEYSDMNCINRLRYDSYIKPVHLLELGDFRLLEVDYRAIVPTVVEAILVVTSDDLLHSFSIPTISVKIDANPARLNARIVKIVIPGLYFGQCSELCGVNHSFMPIVIEATSLSLLQLWLILWHYSGITGTLSSLVLAITFIGTLFRLGIALCGILSKGMSYMTGLSSSLHEGGGL